MHLQNGKQVSPVGMVGACSMHRRDEKCVQSFGQTT